VDSANNVFASRVLDDFMRVQLLDVTIARPFAGNEQADFIGNGVHHELGEHVRTDRTDRANNSRHDVALAADRADDGRLARAEADRHRRGCNPGTPI